jgi:hypothetical protein
MKTFDAYAVTIGGERLMMHNEQLANPFNEYAQELRKVTHKKNKTLEEYEEAARIEFQGGLYFDEKKGPFFPAHCLAKMLNEGARRRKLGKQVEQNVIVPDEVNPVLYEGPRTRDGLWKAKARFADQRLVGVGDKRILRTRPVFREWSITFTLHVFPGAINGEDIRSALEAAESIGLGDGRPVYAGQFVLKSFEVVK